ncbi:MAG TPA: NUDIX hydrolase [Bacteroidales bacterium]|nr:NUDIX hydrolase [Bacteroidales bacterium]
MAYTYPYPRPAVTADAIIYKKNSGIIEVLLIKRAHPPFQDCWALPGGFLDMAETLEECVAREIEEETGLIGLRFEQFEAFSALGRDPRHRTITIVFVAKADTACIPQPGSDAKETAWFDPSNLPPMAFDHELVIKKAVSRAFLE